ncbi:capsule assembly Wzi family protein [Alteromonas sediminis]|uniref:capsule assembly Wzi family protein n=1 Tax=Alteromonas sediminis TaxID=2259342 RepID=UPI00140432AC|nr:capsule assembly Wzi family protein [Alteromonas sediminis]
MVIRKLSLLLFVSFVLAGTKSQASPWVGISDASLHNDVQTLVEFGYLTSVSMTYPLPWKGIDSQLSQITVGSMPSAARIAYVRLQHYLAQTVNRRTVHMAGLHLSSEEKRFSRFSNNEYDKGRLYYSAEMRSGRIAGRAKVNVLDDGSSHIDGSYMAYTFDDWTVRAGMIDQWWGAGQSSSLILSNNARPIKTLALSRATSAPSESAWLRWLGPWYATFQLGQLEAQRHIPNAKLAMSRVNLSPLSNLEIGLSWVAMWGGDGVGNGLGRLFDVMTFREVCADGSENCDPALNTKVGNHLAGYDIKYTLMAFGQPVNLYAQRIGEDAADYWRVTDTADLLGISTYVMGAKVSVEWSDTNVQCNGDDSPKTNCYYEHSEFKSGYRHRGRAIGSAYDSDAEVLTMHVDRRFANGTRAEISMSKIEMNLDGERPSPAVEGVSDALYRINLSYQFPYKSWIFDADIDAYKGIESEEDDTVVVSSTAKWVF